MILLAEITTFNPATGLEEILGLASQDYAHPSAPRFYEGALAESVDASFINREVFQDGTALGAGSVDYGSLVVRNEDGLMDHLVDHYHDGRSVKLFIGEADAAYETFTKIFDGTMTAIEIGVEEAVVRLYDRFAVLLDEQLSDRTLLGTGGPEGTADMEGDSLPVIYGFTSHSRCLIVDEPNQICLVSDRGVFNPTEVRVRGRIIPQGVVRATLSALTTTAAAVDTYDIFKGDATTPCYIRFGSNLDGEVTVSGRMAASDAECTPAQVFQKVLTERTGESVLAGDITALDSETTAVCGGTWSSEQTLREVLDQIARTAGAYFWRDPTGVWRLRRLKAPTGTSTLRFARFDLQRAARVDENEVLSLSPLYTTKASGGITPWKVDVRFNRTNTVQAISNLAAEAPNKEVLSKEWRTAFGTPDLTVKEQHPLSPTLVIDTLLRDRADAEAESTRMKTLLTERKRYSAVVELDQSSLGLLDLGVEVIVEYDRLGLESGKSVIILGYELDLLSQIATLTVWG